jgi:nitroimidazol reductase NimA-like FMN-containing flavoprotein (pyridoxamine 5'-phosphate oxidase superfamily)
MDDAEWRAFVSEGTRTGKLATTRHDGRPHVVPIWFVLDGETASPRCASTTSARRMAS